MGVGGGIKNPLGRSSTHLAPPPENLNVYAVAEFAERTRDQGRSAVMTRRTQRRLLGVWILAIGTVTASVCRADSGDGPCARIMEACRNAGFVQGGNKTGNGLHMDCIEPIMQETPQRARASRPLPDVDPHLVAACKEKNASFGQRRTSQSEGAQPSPTSAPPLTVLNGVKRSNVVFVLTD